MLRPVGVHDPQRRFPFVFELVDVLPRVDDARAVRRDLRVVDALPVEPVLGREQRRRPRFLRRERRAADGDHDRAHRRERKSLCLCHGRSPGLRVGAARQGRPGGLTHAPPLRHRHQPLPSLRAGRRLRRRRALQALDRGAAVRHPRERLLELRGRFGRPVQSEQQIAVQLERRLDRLGRTRRRVERELDRRRFLDQLLGGGDVLLAQTRSTAATSFSMIANGFAR